MLVVEGLTCRFGAMTAVKEASFEIARGSFIGVIGRSGAGKSTLLRMINRLVEPSEGKVMFEGVDVTALKGAELRQWRAKSAMIFQQFNLVGRLDVHDQCVDGSSGPCAVLALAHADVARRRPGHRHFRA